MSTHDAATVSQWESLRQIATTIAENPKMSLEVSLCGVVFHLSADSFGETPEDRRRQCALFLAHLAREAKRPFAEFTISTSSPGPSLCVGTYTHKGVHLAGITSRREWRVSVQDVPKTGRVVVL